MSARSDASGEHLTATLTGITAASRVFMACWYKRDSALALGTTNTALHLAADTAGAQPNLRCGLLNTGSALRIIPNGSTFTSATLASTADVWEHLGFSYGPWDGASRARRMALNGTWDENNFTATLSTADMNALAIGCSHGGGATRIQGNLAEVGVWVGLTTGQEDTLLAELQTIHVDSVSIAPDFSWRMTNAALLTAATGGIDLTAAGATADADEPPGLTDGGGASYFFTHGYAY